MKLIFKTFLVISLVTLTSALALAARTEAKDPCETDWSKCPVNPAEPRVAFRPGVEASSPEASRPGGCRENGNCFKSTNQSELTKVTMRQTQGASGLTDKTDGTTGDTPGHR